MSHVGSVNGNNDSLAAQTVSRSVAGAAETASKEAALGSEAKADNTSNVTEAPKTATPAPKKSIFVKKDNMKSTPAPKKSIFVKMDNVKSTPALQSEASEKNTNTETTQVKEAYEAYEVYEANNREQVNAEAELSVFA